MSPFILIPALTLSTAALLYLYYRRSLDLLSAVWGSSRRLQRPYADDAAWFKQQFAELEQVRMEESIAAHSQATFLTPITAAQTWTIADGIATVYDRATHKRHSYEVHHWGIVQDHGKQIVVNLSLVHLFRPFDPDTGTMKTRSYFRLYSLLSINMDGGAVIFETADAIKLPATVAEMQDDRMLALMRQCRSCQYVHWQRYGNSLLVCGVHPEGKLECEDWKRKSE